MRAPLLPKLRGKFAEFLGQSSLTRLSILNSPTCVRLQYEHLVIKTTRFFSEAWDQSLYEANASRTHFSGLMRNGFAYSSPYKLEPGYPSPG